MYTPSDHSFAVCAYKDNPHLEETIESLEAQTLQSNIFLSTSTPSRYVQDICSRHSIEMLVNPVHRLAGDDWNYAYEAATTPLVTIAHQDDIYEPHFLDRNLTRLNIHKPDDVILTFTDYYELRNGKRVTTNRLLRIKRLMLAGFMLPGASSIRFIRRASLSFGDAICCPSVTYVKTNAGHSIFDTHYINSCDYKTFVDLAEVEGAFVYIPEMLLGHRIYSDSATTKNVANGVRSREDQEIMSSYWPARIAKLINQEYVKSENSNDL